MRSGSSVRPASPLAGCKSEDDGTGSVEGDLNPFRCGNGDKFAAATAKAPEELSGYEKVSS